MTRDPFEDELAVSWLSAMDEWYPQHHQTMLNKAQQRALVAILEEAGNRTCPLIAYAVADWPNVRHAIERENQDRPVPEVPSLTLIQRHLPTVMAVAGRRGSFGLINGANGEAVEDDKTYSELHPDDATEGRA